MLRSVAHVSAAGVSVVFSAPVVCGHSASRDSRRSGVSGGSLAIVASEDIKQTHFYFFFACRLAQPTLTIFERRSDAGE